MKPLCTFTIAVFTLTQLAGSPALFGQAAPAPASTNASEARIQFSATTFDFGKVLPTDKPVHEFIFTNTGTTLLEITDVRPGCGCTTAGTWDRQVQPGKTGKIPLQFNPANFSGTVTKGATVTCNDSTHPNQYLQFQATIWRPIDMQPQYAYFLPVDGESTNETKVIRIVNNQEEAITLESPQTSTPVFKTEVKTVKPGKEFELHVTYTGPVSNASMNGSITVKTSSTNLPTLTLTAMVMPQPALVAMPQLIQLPPSPLPPDYRQTVSIRNNGQSHLKLTDPSVNAEGVTVQMQEVQPGKNFTLTLGFPSNFRVPAGQATELTVKTSHPKYPLLKVPINQPTPVVAPVPVATPVAAGGK